MKHSKEEWQRITNSAIESLAEVESKEYLSNTAKSLRHLISRGIQINNIHIAKILKEYCSKQIDHRNIRIHLVNQLETWARKHITQTNTTHWNDILAILHIPSHPQVKEQEEGTAHVHFCIPDRQGDRTSIME